jgi:hypothetical protein
MTHSEIKGAMANKNSHFAYLNVPPPSTISLYYFGFQALIPIGLNRQKLKLTKIPGKKNKGIINK